jgi:hypothetical protein
MKSEGVSAVEALALDDVPEVAPGVEDAFGTTGVAKSLTESGEMDMIAPRF